MAVRGNQKLPPITIETYRDKLCFPVTEYYCQLGFDYETDPYPRLAEEFIEEYHRRRFECDLHSDARALINFFQGLELSQAVLSAYEQKALLAPTSSDSTTSTPPERLKMGSNTSPG